MVQVVNSPDSIVDGQVAPYPEPSGALRMTIPKGRIQEKVLGLLNQIGLNFLANDRSYRPLCSDPGFTTKLLKSQNIPGLVA
ncbi:MAG TPA: hypothetical protein PLC15_21790, partial [Candidatus Obscuribacter sp.]|nr:hypothetical protein [Candidatus Obscuribacter sp.]